MSYYVRFGWDSDVYVYASSTGMVCCGCWLNHRGDWHDVDRFIAHLHEHVAAGHEVPPELLKADSYDLDDFSVAVTP